MAQVLRPWMEDEGTSKDLRDFIFYRFGTWTNAMFTIFEITMSPGGFVQYRRLYEEVHALFGMFFVVYVCVVTFAVVRVITAMFLKATLAASATDEHTTALDRAREQANYIMDLSSIVVLDSEKRINASALNGMLEFPHFQEWLEHVGLERPKVLRIFNTLDPGNGKVAFFDFTSALLHMTGLPRGVDSIINFYETRSILLRVSRIEQNMCSGDWHRVSSPDNNRWHLSDQMMVKHDPHRDRVAYPSEDNDDGTVSAATAS